MEIKSLKNTEFSAIFKAFENAFIDYEVHLNAEEFKLLLTRRGFDRKMSFAAFVKNEIVAFTLNGIGLFNNKKTAYDTGTGTIKEFRGQGLATKIFEHAVPILINHQVECYLLEVLQHNTPAVSIYKKLGFSTTREFNYFIWDSQISTFEHKANPFRFTIGTLLEENLPILESFWDYKPSWQNSLESVYRAKDRFLMLGAFADQRLVGYCIFEPQTGDITQLAVDKNHRRKGIASSLLHHIHQTSPSKKMKLINAETSCFSLEHFLRAQNINIQGKQFEMVKIL